MIVSQQRSVSDAAHMNRYILFNEGNYFSEFIHLVEEDYIVSRLLEYAQLPVVMIMFLIVMKPFYEVIKAHYISISM